MKEITEPREGNHSSTYFTSHSLGPLSLRRLLHSLLPHLLLACLSLSFGFTGLGIPSLHDRFRDGYMIGFQRERMVHGRRTVIVPVQHTTLRTISEILDIILWEDLESSSPPHRALRRSDRMRIG